MQINSNYFGKIILFFETAVLSAVCFLLIHQYSDPSGGDGYFYLKQIKILSEQFKFYHYDYSLFFVLAAFLKKTGFSDLLAYQLTTVFSYGLLVYISSLFFYDKVKTFSNKLLNMVLSSIFLILFSVQKSVLKLCFEFAKNGLAIAFFMAAIYFFDQNKIKRSFLFFFIAVLTHKIVLMYFVLFVLFTLLEFKLFIKFKKLFIVLASVVSFLCLFGLYFNPRLKAHALHFIENIQLEKVFFLSFENQLIPLSLVGAIFFWCTVGLSIYLKKRQTDRLVFKKELVSILDTNLNHKNNYFEYQLILLFSLFCLVPFLPLFSGYNLEIKFRLFLNSFIFGFLVFCFSLKQIKKNIHKKIYLGLVASILIYQSFQYNGFPWIMSWSSKIKNLDLISNKISENKIVVTHHGLQFYIDYKTPIRARSLLTPGKAPDYQIAYTPEFYKLSPELADEIKQIEILSLGDSYGLFNYSDFQSLMRDFPLLADWRNQFQLRPDFVQSYDQE